MRSGNSQLDLHAFSDFFSLMEEEDAHDNGDYMVRAVYFVRTPVAYAYGAILYGHGG